MCKRINLNDTKIILQPKFDGVSCVLELNDRALWITERYCATLPYAMLSGVYEDSHVILLDIGAGELHFVPKRTLTKEEQQRLQQHLKRVMNEKYKQEGVR